jgi:hypothetical protein
MDTDWKKGSTMLDTNCANDRQLNSRQFVKFASRPYPCLSVFIRGKKTSQKGTGIGTIREWRLANRRNELAIGMNSKQKNEMRRDCLICPGWPQKNFTGVERESDMILLPASASRRKPESHERKIG